MFQNKPVIIALAALMLLMILAYGTLLFFTAARQESLIFHPVSLPLDHVLGGHGWTESSIPVRGARLSALHFRQPDAAGLVFILHGNSGNLAGWMPDTEFYRQAGYDVFIFDYRGFGKSSGKIENEAQLHADALEAWKTATAEYGERPVIVYGQSLGTGLAVRLATQVNPAQLILVSPYASFVRLANEKYPWVPSFLLRYPLRIDQWLASVKSPVLMITGGLDTLVPPEHAESLHAAYPATELVVIPMANHSDIVRQTKYLDLYRERLEMISKQAKQR